MGEVWLSVRGWDRTSPPAVRGGVPTIWRIVVMPHWLPFRPPLPRSSPWQSPDRLLGPGRGRPAISAAAAWGFCLAASAGGRPLEHNPVARLVPALAKAA